jgi:predicted nucleotidyltransferase
VDAPQPERRYNSARECLYIYETLMVALDVNNTNTGELDLIIHMGDQIYADDVLARWREKLSNRTATAETEADQDQQDYEQLVEDYRNVYRITFGQRTPATSRATARTAVVINLGTVAYAQPKRRRRCAMRPTGCSSTITVRTVFFLKRLTADTLALCLL